MTDEAARPPPDELPAVGLDRGRVDDAVYEPFNPGPIPWKRGEDGLPSPNLPTALPTVAPLHLKTFVCMADRSEYVRRDERWGDIVERFQPGDVARSEAGSYYAECDKKQGLTLIEHVKRFFGWRILERVEVEPIRPQCKFLARQMVDFQDAPENQLIERLCTARRDENSFFLSVSNSQVHACEMRSPPDPVSAARLDRFDDAKLRLGKERYERDGAFDVDAALARTEAEADKGIAFGGIFKDS